MPHPGIHRENGYMFQIHSDPRIQEKTESRLRVGDGRGHNHLILLPFRRIDRNFSRSMSLHFSHSGPVYQLDSQLGRDFSFRQAGPYTETVLFTFLESDTEETIVLKCRMLMRMTGIHQPDIVRVTFKRAVIPYFHTSSHTPALKPVARELEGAVLHQLGIESPVSSKIYILDEDSVHCRLDFCPKPAYIHLHLQSLR